MADRPRSESRRRPVMVGVRMTYAEHAALVAAAKRDGMSAPEVLRAAFLSHESDRQAAEPC